MTGHDGLKIRRDELVAFNICIRQPCDQCIEGRRWREAVVAQIEDATKADGWKFSRVIVEIAKSYPFTHIRSTP